MKIASGKEIILSKVTQQKDKSQLPGTQSYHLFTTAFFLTFTEADSGRRWFGWLVSSPLSTAVIKYIFSKVSVIVRKYPYLNFFCVSGLIGNY